MKQVIQGMNLSEMDIGLLRYLHAVKVSTYERIKRDVYPGYHLASVCNRVYRLERNGLVAGYRNRTLAKGKRCLSITAKGFSEFVAQGDESLIELKSDAINHDLTLADIRCWLRQAGRVDRYYTENELQTWKRYQTDIFGHGPKVNGDAGVLLKFSLGDVPASLEYELSSKSKDRYEALVRKYYRSDVVPLVLYLCGSLSLLEKVSKIERELVDTDQPKFFYKVLRDPIENDDFIFRNCHGFTLNLHQDSAYEQATN